MWKLYDDIIDGIDKDILVEDMFVGEYSAVIKSSIGTGIGGVYQKDTRLPSSIKEFKGKKLYEVAKCIKSWNLTEAGIGLAAINSYYNSVDVIQSRGINLNKSNFMEDRLNDPFISYQNDIKGKKVAALGHFHFLDLLFAPVCDLSIIGSERTRYIEGDFPETAAPYILPEQDFVILPCHCFQEKTLPWYLELCKNAYVIIVGSLTPMAPILFEYGVNDLSGFVIRDEKRFMNIVSGNERSGISYSTGQKVSLKSLYNKKYR